MPHESPQVLDGVTAFSWTDHECRSRRRSKARAGVVERTVAARDDHIGPFPEVVARQADMCPAHRRDVGEQLLRHGLAPAAQMFDRALKVEGVPVRDGSDDEVQPRGAVLLVFQRAVGEASLPMGVDRLRQRVPRLAFVQANLAGPAQQRPLLWIVA